MSTPALMVDPAVDAGLAATPEVPQTQPEPAVGRRLVKGTAVLGAAVMAERGAGFLANILAARLGGAPVFGAYALGLSTANNISTYAAGGIGATATRFSGKYNTESGGYGVFARAMALVALVSAAIAALALLAGAGPIAQLLHKPELTPLLRWASLAAAGMILLECARGFFVGQHKLVALGALSLLVGSAMVLLLPAVATSHHAQTMIVVQGAITMGAVLMCLLLARPLRLLVAQPAQSRSVAFGPLLREVWAFGFVQLFGLLSANLAGWWLTVLVARSDTTLVEMGLFAVASQFRNLTGIVPALLTESSYAVMADKGTGADEQRDRVMAVCTFASIMASFVLAGVGIVSLPLLLRLLYGTHYSGAAAAAAAGMAVAVVQMGNAPPTARMSIVTVRWVAIGNTLWAVLVAVAATVWMRHGGSAALAMAIFLGGHILLAMLVLCVLRAYKHLPRGVLACFATSTAAVATLAALAALRSAQPTHSIGITAGMLLLLALSAALLFHIGKREAWLVAFERPLRMIAAAVGRWRLLAGASLKGAQ